MNFLELGQDGSVGEERRPPRAQSGMGVCEVLAALIVLCRPRAQTAAVAHRGRLWGDPSGRGFAGPSKNRNKTEEQSQLTPTYIPRAQRRRARVLLRGSETSSYPDQGGQRAAEPKKVNVGVMNSLCPADSAAESEPELLAC